MLTSISSFSPRSFLQLDRDGNPKNETAKTKLAKIREQLSTTDTNAEQLAQILIDAFADGGADGYVFKINEIILSIRQQDHRMVNSFGKDVEAILAAKQIGLTVQEDGQIAMRKIPVSDQPVTEHEQEVEALLHQFMPLPLTRIVTGYLREDLPDGFPVEPSGEFGFFARNRQVLIDTLMADGTTSEKLRNAKRFIVEQAIAQGKSGMLSALFGETLEGGGCRGANLSGVDLSHLKLEGIVFREVNLSGADLTGAQLSGARFPRTILADANLTGVEGDDVVFSGADMQRVRLLNANLSNVAFGKAVRIFYSRSFREVVSTKLCGANFEGSRLHHVDFSDADCTKANFRSTTMRDANFAATNLTGSILLDANLTGSNLGRAGSLRDMQMNDKTAASLSIAAKLRLMMSDGVINVDHPKTATDD